MRTVVVLGAAGRVGDAVARAFLEAGWTVRGVARGAKAAGLPAGVEVADADAFDREALVAACAGADVVVNALNPPYTDWDDKAMPMAQNVAAAVKAAGATHMLPGNVYNFGHAIGMGMAEDAPVSPSTAKARVRIAMEEMFRRLAAEEGVRTVVLRAGDFYGGPLPGTWHDLMILPRLDRGVLVWPGPADCPHAFAYLPDLGRAFVALAARRGELGGFEAVHFEGHTLTGNEVKATAEAITGRRLKLRGVPWPLLRAAGLVMPMMREVAAMSYLWRMPHSLDGSKFRALVPDFAVTPPEAALRETVEALGLSAGAGRQAA